MRQDSFALKVALFLLGLLLAAGSAAGVALADSDAERAGPLRVGWAMANLTPDVPVHMAGMGSLRVSEGVIDPVTGTRRGRPRRVTPDMGWDVDNYDACYLPDDRIVFTSNAFMAAVPCVNGGTRIANLYLMNLDGSAMRQLGFDQEHSWCPTVLPNGHNRGFVEDDTFTAGINQRIGSPEVYG